jgi:ribosome modulation factor
LFCLLKISDMKTDTERLKARMEGAKAALEGRKMETNTYDESDDLHFEWLAGWVGTRLETKKPPRRPCGWRGMAGGEGCVRPHGHDGGHGFSDGSGFRQNAEVTHPETKP